jgi:uncharacterized membrane protein YdjX (TVP38/TMEM64 family)
MADLKLVVRIARVALLTAWAAVIGVSLYFYFADPAAFSAASIAEFIRTFQSEIWLVYFAMSALRGLTLLPSTPLVLAGAITFPDQPVAVLAVSLAGIALSSTMIYFFSELLGFTFYFERHDPDRIHAIKAKLEHPLGFLFVAAWAFFPLVPTDLVCYLAGTTRMNYWRFILAVLFGETILCSIYVFGGGSLVNILRGQ